MDATLKGCFVTGTDTGIGKTVVSAALLHGLGRLGLSAVGMKPVASGCEPTPAGLRNADALALQSASAADTPYADVNPYTFEPPIAPHIAAAEVGVEIRIDHIVDTARRLAGPFDAIVVEGVGGWLVPFGAGVTVADLARELDLPVVLVVGMRLGCLNHALLSAQSVRACGCRLAGWVANTVEPDCARLQDNIATLQRCLEAPLLGTVPNLPVPDPGRAAADHLDLDRVATLV